MHYLLQLRRRRFDYAIGFWTQDNILLTLATLGSRTKVVLCEHNSWFYPPWHVRLLRRFLYPRAHRVTVLNRAELKHYGSYLDNVALVPNALQPAAAAPEENREKLIIGVGHLIPRKGFHDLIAAFERSHLGLAGWRLAIVGDGPEKPRLEALVRERKIANVEFSPPTSHISEWYRRAALIGVSSDVEVFSLVLAEAIQAGVVPVAYAADGPAYILEAFPDQLVQIGDVGSLAARLAWTATADLAELNAAMRTSLEARMSRRAVVDMWRALLHRPSI